MCTRWVILNVWKERRGDDRWWRVLAGGVGAAGGPGVGGGVGARPAGDSAITHELAKYRAVYYDREVTVRIIRYSLRPKAVGAMIALTRCTYSLFVGCALVIFCP